MWSPVFVENQRFRVKVYKGGGTCWIMDVTDRFSADNLIDGRHDSEHEARTAARNFLESAEIAPASMTLSELADVLNGG